MKDGSSSSFPIVRLASRYNKMLSDGVVLSNRAAVDLIDVRIRQLLERVDVEEAPDRVKHLYEQWQELKSCVSGMPGYLEAQTAIDLTFERVYHDYASWRQIFEALELRGKSTEREIKALQQIKAIMTAEDGYQLASKMLAAVMRVLGDDPKKIKQVQYEFSRLIGESSDRVTDGFDEDDDGGSAEVGGAAGFGDVDQAELLYSGDKE